MTNSTTIAGLPESNDRGDIDREIRFLGDMQRLQVKPGDVYVLTCDGQLSDEESLYIHRWWKKNMHGTKCIVLGGGMKLGVVSACQPIDPRDE